MIIGKALCKGLSKKYKIIGIDLTNINNKDYYK